MTADRVVRALVAVQLVALLVVGMATVARFQLWAPIDERAHFDYVSKVANEQRLPRIDEPLSREVVAVKPGDVATWQRAPTSVERDSYEAFQPPLFYLVAAPVLAVAGDGITGVRALRVFGLLLLFAAAAALADLCRLVAGRAWLLPFAAGLAVLLWPGLVVRGITVSNASLELVLALLLLGQAWRAWAREDDRALVLAGGLVGLLLLTKLTAVHLAPLLAVLVALRVRRAPGRRALGVAAVALALPALVLAPWVVSNLDRYGAPTANEAAREQQTEYLRPTGLFELGFGDGNRALVGGVFPQEWEDNAVFDRGEPPADVLAVAVFLAFAAGLVAAVRRRQWRAVVLLGAPFVLGALMMNLTLATSDWYIFLPRYLHAAMLALAVLAAAMALRLRHGPAIVAATATTATAVAGALWVFGAATGYFTNVGDAIGL